MRILIVLIWHRERFFVADKLCQTASCVELNYKVSVIVTWTGDAILLANVFMPTNLKFAIQQERSKYARFFQICKAHFMQIARKLSDLKHSIHTILSNTNRDRNTVFSILVKLVKPLLKDCNVASVLNPVLHLIRLHLEQLKQHIESGSVESYNFDPGNSNLDINLFKHGMALLDQFSDFMLMAFEKRLPAYRIFTTNIFMNVRDGDFVVCDKNSTQVPANQQ